MEENERKALSLPPPFLPLFFSCYSSCSIIIVVVIILLITPYICTAPSGLQNIFTYTNILEHHSNLAR